MTMFWIIEFMAGVIENIIGLLFIGHILSTKIEKYNLLLLFSVALTIGLSIINYFSLFSVTATIYGVVGMTICAYILFKEKLLDILVAVGSFLLLLHLLDFFLITILGSFTGVKEFGSLITTQMSMGRALYVLWAKFSLIIIYFFLIRFLKRLPVSYKKVMISVFVALSLIYYLEKKLYQEMRIEVIGMGILLLLVIILGIYLMIQYSEAREAKMQAEMLIERNNVMIRGYEDMLENYKNSSVYFHDIKHHIMRIQQYLTNNENSEALNYINSIDSNYRDISNRIWTGTVIIDFILNYKKRIAEKEGINFVIDTDIVHIDNISESDLCALLGNIIDNAIEHCDKTEEMPVVRVAIRKIHEMLIIKVTNICKEAPLKKDNQWITSKKDKNAHGWGMKSIEMITNKYEGVLQCIHEKNLYSVTLTFFH